MSLVTVVGVGVLCIILLYMMNSLDSEKHQILKMLVLLFIISIMMYIPKGIIDAQTVCETVVNTSTDLDATTTQYNYTSYCYARPETTGIGFLGTTQRLYWLLIGYTIVFVAMWSLLRLMDSWKARR